MLYSGGDEYKHAPQSCCPTESFSIENGAVAWEAAIVTVRLCESLNQPKYAPSAVR